MKPNQSLLKLLRLNSRAKINRIVNFDKNLGNYDSLK